MSKMGKIIRVGSMGRNIRMKLVIQTIQNNQTKKTLQLKRNRIIQQI